MDTPRTPPDETPTQAPVAPATEPDELTDADLETIAGGDNPCVDNCYDPLPGWTSNGGAGQ